MHIGLNAHLLSRQSGYRSAGIHGVIHNLLLHLPENAPADWQFTAMLGKNNPAQYDRVTLRRARLDTESPVKRILWEQLAQPWQLGGFDLVHQMAFVAPIVSSRPMVVTVYDLSFVHYPARLSTARRLYLRLLTGLTCRRARRVMVISESTGRDLTAVYGIPPEKIDVTLLGYDAARFRPLEKNVVDEFKRQKGLPARFWLFIGTLEPRKNLPMLLEAYSRLPRDERLPLILAGGKGWLYEDIFAAIERYHLQEEVHLPGFLPTEELPLWYNSAEMFLYPSVFEGFGLPVLEAMACGTPAVTSNVSSLPEVAGNAALCLPPDEVEAWSEALRRARTDVDWRGTMREAGLSQAQHFHWKRTARHTLNSYRRALYLTEYDYPTSL